jgi:hypothetical protein
MLRRIFWVAALLLGQFDFPSPAILWPIVDLHFVQGSQPAEGMRRKGNHENKQYQGPTPYIYVRGSTDDLDVKA